MKDIRQTPEYADYLSKVGWEVEIAANVNYFIRKLPLVGSFMKVQRPERLNLKTAGQLAKKYRAFQLIIEPRNESQKLQVESGGFKKTKPPFLPSLTLCLDLTSSKEKILANFKKDARSVIKRGGRLKITDYGKRVEKFRTIWKKTVGLKRYVPPLSHIIALKKSFGKNALFLAYRDSGAVFLKAGEAAYYWQAFTGSVGRKNQIQYKIVWEGIIWAKKRGAKTFDFEGIYDPRFPNKDWQGFTHFKKSFGGYEVEYPGAFSKILLPFKR